MVETARHLGGLLDMHMRVDLFASSAGVVIGEFTPWHSKGKVHCVTTSNHTSNASGAFDPCQMGRIWSSFRQRYNSIEGGRFGAASRVTPMGILGWERILENDTRKCQVAVSMLRPERRPAASWPKGKGTQNKGSVGRDNERARVGVAPCKSRTNMTHCMNRSFWATDSRGLGSTRRARNGSIAQVIATASIHRLLDKWSMAKRVANSTARGALVSSWRRGGLQMSSIKPRVARELKDSKRRPKSAAVGQKAGGVSKQRAGSMKELDRYYHPKTGKVMIRRARVIDLRKHE